MNNTLLKLAGIKQFKTNNLEMYSNHKILSLINKRLNSNFTSIQEVTTSEIYNDLRNNQSIQSLPWYSFTLDKDIDGFLKKYKNIKFNILDIGTGPGSQAILLKKSGHNVVASDISRGILRKARVEAKMAGIKISFRHDDILNTTIREKFNLIIDRGCLHNVFYSKNHKGYVVSIVKLLEKGGFLLLKILSDKEQRHNPNIGNQSGPYRFKKKELIDFFGKNFKMLKFTNTYFEGSDLVPLKGKFIIFQKNN